MAGGEDADILIGGEGQDIFVLQPGEGIDTFVDFTPGQDLLQFGGGGFETLTLVQQNENTLISFGSDGLAILLNSSASALSAADLAL